ncbi:MAG: hypothetical protein R3Y39_08975 [Rikenellaceae bacterium]
MSRAISPRYLDAIELCKRVCVKSDYGGCNTDDLVVVEKVFANVEELTGSRLEWYKSRGYSKPVVISFYDISEVWDAIKWQDREIEVKSRDRDKNNVLITVVTADFVDDKC